MVDSNLEASRPKARRPRQSSTPQKQATDTLFKGLDRFGLAPILLIALAYLGHTQIVQPIATAYMKMVAQVGDTNEMLRREIEKNNLDDMERVAAISAAQSLNQKLAETNRELNLQIIQALSAANEERRKIHGETQAVLERVVRVLDKDAQK